MTYYLLDSNYGNGGGLILFSSAEKAFEFLARDDDPADLKDVFQNDEVYYEFVEKIAIYQFEEANELLQRFDWQYSHVIIPLEVDDESTLQGVQDFVEHRS